MAVLDRFPVTPSNYIKHIKAVYRQRIYNYLIKFSGMLHRWLQRYHTRIRTLRSSLVTHYDETKKRACDSHVVRDKENLKLSHGGPSLRQASVINQLINALRQGCYWVCGLTHRRAIKEQAIAIDRVWVYNQACRLSHDIHVTYPTHL